MKTESQVLKAEMKNNSPKIVVLGAGSWGTSLAILLSKKGYDVTLWDRNEDRIQTLRKTRKNEKYLGQIELPETLNYSSDLINSVKNAEIIVLGTPSHSIRDIIGQIKSVIRPDHILVNLAKGIENQTLLTMSAVIKNGVPEIAEKQIVALYGPSHAEEVSKEMPTTLVAASSDLETAKYIQNLFMTPFLRVYSNMDILGVEIGGSIKNVMAIATGILDGMGFGDNAKAALLTRGMNEITRMGLTLGAKKETFAGLTGIGDLIVTCMSKHSRNRYVGEQIGKGKTLEQVLSEMVMVAEGVKTTRSAHDLSIKLGIDMPITDAVYAVLFENKSVKTAVHELMTRTAKEEEWGI